MTQRPYLSVQFEDSHLSDLMLRSQGGDQESYFQLLNLCQEMLLKFIRRKLGEIDSLDDVLQEVVLAVHSKRHTYDSNRSFKSWLFAIAHYKVMDYFRAYYKSKEREVTYSSDRSFENDLAELGISSFEQFEFEQDLAEAMKHLNDKQRIIVDLVKIKGHTINEAAEIVGLSETNVKVQIHRAIKEMRNSLEERP